MESMYCSMYYTSEHDAYLTGQAKIKKFCQMQEVNKHYDNQENVELESVVCFF